MQRSLRCTQLYINVKMELCTKCADNSGAVLVYKEVVEYTANIMHFIIYIPAIVNIGNLHSKLS